MTRVCALTVTSVAGCWPAAMRVRTTGRRGWAASRVSASLVASAVEVGRFAGGRVTGGRTLAVRSAATGSAGTDWRMSYDLAVWEGPRPSSDEEAAGEFARLMGEMEETHRPASPAIKELAAELVTRWPELGEAGDEECSWLVGGSL